VFDGVEEAVGDTDGVGEGDAEIEGDADGVGEGESPEDASNTSTTAETPYKGFSLQLRTT
jgi:hypothetical protein